CPHRPGGFRRPIDRKSDLTDDVLPTIMAPELIVGRKLTIFQETVGGSFHPIRSSPSSLIDLKTHLFRAISTSGLTDSA
ncbi:hypothetical protein BGX34_011195, partial [Mortierella sp. NVP85]